VKKISLELSNNEYRAFKIIIDNGYSVCQSDCVYNECTFTIARQSLENMFK